MGVPQSGTSSRQVVPSGGSAGGWDRHRTGERRRVDASSEGLPPSGMHGAQTLSRRVTPSGGTPRSGNAVGLWSAGRWERLRVGKWPDVDRRLDVKGRRWERLQVEGAGPGVPSGGPVAGRRALQGEVPPDGNAADRNRCRGVGHRREERRGAGTRSGRGVLSGLGTPGTRSAVRRPDWTGQGGTGTPSETEHHQAGKIIARRQQPHAGRSPEGQTAKQPAPEPPEQQTDDQPQTSARS